MMEVYFYIYKCLLIWHLINIFLLCQIGLSLAEDGGQSDLSPVRQRDGSSPNPLRRAKRSAFHLYSMITCGTECDPIKFKGYGCYCGLLGSGEAIDGIDRCCKEHDWCYDSAPCKGLEHYLAPYKWKCNGGNPYCIPAKGVIGGTGSCGHRLCECDRIFVSCIAQHPCPRRLAMCTTSPIRYWQNIFMGVSTGAGIKHKKPPPTHHHYAVDA